MRILMLGATGFLGSWITNKLIQREHEVICVVRNRNMAAEQYPNSYIIESNFFATEHLDVWISRLNNVDVIINCVGIFNHPIKSMLWCVHYEIPKLIYQAAEVAKVKKIIHVSALGIERYKNDYARSKQAIEDYLKKSNVPNIIIKPSLIYGPGGKGGMAFIRNLAALPFITALPGKGTQCFQPIHVRDLSEAIVRLAESPISKPMSLHAVSKEHISLKKIMQTLRQWLGLKSAIEIPVPIWFIKLIAKVAKPFRLQFLNITAIEMLEQGNTTNEKLFRRFEKMAGIKIANFQEGLQSMPATNTDRLEAKLFLLRPLLRLSLAFMWYMSAVVSFMPYAKNTSYAELSLVGIPEALQAYVLHGAILLNLGIATFLFFNIKTHWNCLVQIGVILLYTFIISVKLPFLWLEPFGPIVKNVPILMSIWMLYLMEKTK